MQDYLRNIAHIKLDRSNWTHVKFSDIAIQQKQSVDRENTELTRYVKGEHMRSEDLHLRSWGELTDEYLGPAFVRKFEEGEILYGSRRTYLRKVVVAPFEGITSNTTFVIKAVEKRIDKRLLPFIMLSEGFSQHSIRHSKGSVNPYVNWKDLAEYEFLLPPKPQQLELVKLLWSMDKVIEHTRLVKEALDRLLKSVLKNRVTNVPGASSKIELKEIATVQHGFPFKSEYWAEDDPTLPIAVTIGNYDYEGGFRFDSTKVKCYNGSYPKEYELAPGDLLLAMTCQTPGGEILGIPGLIADDGRLYLHNQRIGKVEIIPECQMTKSFLYLVFLTDKFRRFLLASASGTKVLHTSPSKILKYKISLPDIDYQCIVEKEVTSIFQSKERLEKKINSSSKLQKALINNIFEHS